MYPLSILSSLKLLPGHKENRSVEYKRQPDGWRFQHHITDYHRESPVVQEVVVSG
jgi:hypothetical protein